MHEESLHNVVREVSEKMKERGGGGGTEANNKTAWISENASQ